MTDWTKNPILPRGNMAFWHQYEPAVSGHNIIYDYSGNNRVISCAAPNAPVLTSNVFNGQPGWYFNGSRDPLNYTGAVNFKHLFILASVDEAAFSAFRGLFSEISGTTILVGDNGTTKFFDNSTSITATYRKADVGFAQNNQQAPMSLVPAVLEIQAPGGFAFASLQVGSQTSLSRLWKGYFFDDLAYSEILNDAMRQRIYEYYAMRYQVWSRDSTNTYDTFPFAANRTRALDLDQETFLSTPYSGDPHGLVRGNYVGAYELPFLLREQDEWDAAKAFLKQKGRTGRFVIRDYRYYPYREVVVRRTSSIREQGSEVTYRFNYSFDVTEA